MSSQQCELLISQALTATKAQCRQRCWLETTKSHENIVAWIQSVLPAWEIVAPPRFHRILGKVLHASACPENSTEARNALRRFLGLPPTANVEDMINGHHESRTAALVMAVLARLHGGCVGHFTGPGTRGELRYL